VVQGDEGKDQEVPQQRELEDAEEPRRVSNYNCSNAQHHQTRMRRGNTTWQYPNIKGIENEIGVIKKEKSKLRHVLGIEHGSIPIQLDLWGN
jgi:hypothetical protein